MRIKQAAEQTGSLLIESAFMEVDQPPPDVSLDKANKPAKEVDRDRINGNLENGVSDMTQTNFEDESKQGTDLTNHELASPVTNGHSEKNKAEEETGNNHVDNANKDITSENKITEKTQQDNVAENDIPRKLQNYAEGDENDPCKLAKDSKRLSDKSSPEKNETCDKVAKPVINGDNYTPRRSERANKGPGINYNSLVEAAGSQQKKLSIVKPAETKLTEAKVSEPSKQALTPAKVSRLRIDDRKIPEEMEHMRAMAKIVYGIGLDLAKQMVYKDLVRVQGRRQAQGTLNKKEEEQLVKLRKRHGELCQGNKAYIIESKHHCTMPGCEFRTDSIHALEHHKGEPHRTYDDDLLCSICSFSTKTSILFVQHMDEEHKRKAHDYYKLSSFQCNMCGHDAFHKNGLLKHKLKCEKRFNLKRNLNPFYDVCDIPIKKMFVNKPTPTPASLQSVRPVKPTSASQSVTKISDKQFLHLQKQKEKLQKQQQQQQQKLRMQQQKLLQQQHKLQQQQALGASHTVPTMIQQQSLVTQQQLMSGVPAAGFTGQGVPQTYAIGGNMYALVNNNGQYMLQPIQQPPRPQVFPGTSVTAAPSQLQMRPAVTSVPKPQPAAAIATQSKPTTTTSPGLEICEICGGFVKDRMSLRIHFYWAHKIDIRKDVFTRKNPSLACEHCPDRFWTFQGYDRHRKIAHKEGKEIPKAPKTDVVCPLCRTKATHILNHLLSVHNVSVTTALEKRQCTICLISFPSVQEVEEHLIFLHGFSFLQNMDVLKNTKAQVPGSKKSAVKLGQGAPVPVGLFANNKKFDPTCTVCNITFTRVQDFTNHCNKYHIFKCYRCGIRWNSYSLLVRHLSEAHVLAQDLCIICKGKFTAGIPFIQHMLTSHIKGLSIRLKRLSKNTIDRYTKKGQQSNLVLSQKSARNCRVEVINLDLSPSKKRIESDATQSSQKQPIILKIEDSEENETIEIHENTDDIE